jgi:hypothetical protein
MKQVPNLPDCPKIPALGMIETRWEVAGEQFRHPADGDDDLQLECVTRSPRASL